MKYSLSKTKKIKIIVYILQFSHNVYVTFDLVILKGKICFLNLFSVHAARILGLSLEMLSPLKWGTKHLYNSKDYSFISEQVLCFYFLEAKSIYSPIHQDVMAGCKFWDLQCYFLVSDSILNPQWQMFGQ